MLDIDVLIVDLPGVAQRERKAIGADCNPKHLIVSLLRDNLSVDSHLSTVIHQTPTYLLDEEEDFGSSSCSWTFTNKFSYSLVQTRLAKYRVIDFEYMY